MVVGGKGGGVSTTEMDKGIAMSHLGSSLCWFIGYKPGNPSRWQLEAVIRWRFEVAAIEVDEQAEERAKDGRIGRVIETDGFV